MYICISSMRCILIVIVVNIVFIFIFEYRINILDFDYFFVRELIYGYFKCVEWKFIEKEKK